MESATVSGYAYLYKQAGCEWQFRSFWLGTGAGGWETYTDANPLTYVSPSKALLYYYDFNNLPVAEMIGFISRLEFNWPVQTTV